MIVIPMAGESRRFHVAGYPVPKYMLPISGRPLFDWTLLSFKPYFQSEPFLFVVRGSGGVEAFLEARLSELGISNAKVITLREPTAGQAETVETGLQASQASGSSPITIFNIDTVRLRPDLTPPEDSSGWLEVFSALGDNWSFVEPDPEKPDSVRRCVEKTRISDLCCTGLYHFASCDLFLDALGQERRAPSMSELYVAPLYNHLIASGHRIAWRTAPASSVKLSGVPSEYEDLKAAGLGEAMFGLLESTAKVSGGGR